MENLELILNELIAKLLTTGSAEFSQNGLNIKTEYNNGEFTINASFMTPEEDETKELIARFEDYIDSLSEGFFLEATESFEYGKLREIQNKIESKDCNLVKEGINEFMTRLQEIASDKIQLITEDIEDAERKLTELIELRDSYEHVLNKTF